jgi:hypothetical protein
MNSRASLVERAEDTDVVILRPDTRRTVTTYESAPDTFVVPSFTEAPGRTLAEETVELARDGSTMVLPERPAPHVIRLNRFPAPEQHFLLLQLWEGTVVQLIDNEFSAVLYDLTNPSHGDERATFSIEEVADPDRPLLAPGAIFYWSLGYEVVRSGTRKAVSEIRFRRLPAWSRRDIARLNIVAEKFSKLFGSSQDSTA